MELRRLRTAGGGDRGMERVERVEFREEEREAARER
jgi:hypothetical protein